jgi:hypothetical protein
MTAVHDYIAGDSVTLHGAILLFRIDCNSGGTFSETYTLSASLPPASTMAAVPSGGGWLLIGVLLGLGIRVLHGSARKGAVASTVLVGAICLS